MRRFVITLLTIASIVMLGACSNIEIYNKNIEKTTEHDLEQENLEKLSDNIYSFQVEINGELY